MYKYFILIKKGLKKNHIVFNFSKMVLSLLGNILFLMQYFFRRNNIFFSNKYNEIKKFKNKYIGKRCFIVATGPSLEIDDLEKIRNEYSFSMNSIVLLFEDTIWRPNFYGIQDNGAYKNLESEIKKSNFEYIFCGIHNPFILGMTPTLKEKSIKYPIYYGNIGIADMFKDKNLLRYKFSNDCSHIVYNGTTITYSLLQIAIYMGFKEVYLLGVDCHYESGKENYIKDYNSAVKENNFEENIWLNSKMREAYIIAKQYAEKNGIKIYNASSKSKLDVFERKNIKEIFL